jgi:hypothetical protein
MQIAEVAHLPMVEGQPVDRFRRNNRQMSLPRYHSYVRFAGEATIIVGLSIAAVLVGMAMWTVLGGSF